MEPDREADVIVSAHLEKMETRPVRARSADVQDAIRELCALGRSRHLRHSERALLAAMPGEFFPLHIEGDGEWNRAVDRYVDAIDAEAPGYRVTYVAYMDQLAGRAGAAGFSPKTTDR